MSESNRALVRKYWDATTARDWLAFGELLHEDFVYEVPQTRERVRGRSAYVEFNVTYPGDWKLEIDALVVDDDHAVSRISFAVNGEVEAGISFFEFREGLISRIRDYWPAPYEPPVRATQRIERY